MTARPMAWARWLLPVPGGTATYCEVSARDRRPLPLASAVRTVADREGGSTHAGGRAVPRLPLARRDVDADSGMDDVNRAVREHRACRRPRHVSCRPPRGRS